MGCKNCSQKKELDNSKQTEIIYSQVYNKNLLMPSPNILKKNFIYDSIKSQNDNEDENIKDGKDNNEKSKNEKDKDEKNKDEKNKEEKNNEEEMEKLVEMIESIRSDRKKMKILRKFQSRIVGMQLRKKMRFESFKKSQAINFKELLSKNLPLSMNEINDFFEEYPQKPENSELKLEKHEPLKLEGNIIYYGEWDMNFFTKHGRGLQIWPDGSYYKGYWENNKAEGKGLFIHSTGDIYIGNWHNNKRNGKGVYQSKLGMQYNGYWKNDKLEGKGKEIWEDGTSYIGYYSGGQKNGKGEIEWPNGCKYKGDFKNGNMNGKGIYTFNDNRTYEGDFVNNVFEGKGLFTWPNGNKYNGYFKNDKREGFGIFNFADGKILKGMWKNGKQDGEFYVYYPKFGVWTKKIMIEKNVKKVKVNENNIGEDEDEITEDNIGKNKNGKIISDPELEKIDKIEKNEENKIYDLDEDF